MSAMTGARTPHPGDADLLRWIDRQLDLEGSRRLRAHLSTCGDCTGRLDALRDRSRQVSAWIAEIPVQLPDASRRAVALAALERARTRRRMRVPGLGSAVLRIAAMVVLLLGATMSTGTGRSWLGDRVEQVVGPDPGPLGAAVLRVFGRGPEDVRLARAAGAKSLPAPATPSAAPRTTLAELRRAKGVVAPHVAAAVAFGPSSGREVVLVFENLQDRGGALLSIRDVGGASARITRGDHGEKLLATAEGLRVRNRPGSSAEYEIVVPNRIRVVRVRIAKRPDTVLRVRPSKRPWLWTIDLKPTALPPR
jgi:hypothetical protein